MKEIAIYGAGGFGKEVACLIKTINEAAEEPKWKFIGFFDDSKEAGTQVSRYGTVLGGIDTLNAWRSPLDVAVAIGSPHAIFNITKQLTNALISFPNVIHPNFEIVDEQCFSIGHGNVIQSNCFASCDASIGNFNILNGSVVLGHDVKIGDYNVVMPNIRISGEVTIGKGNLLGVGSIILQRINIGQNVHLGAGAVLMTKPKDGCTYLGNPAKRFKY